jgi:hypothetical protein
VAEPVKGVVSNDTLGVPFYSVRILYINTIHTRKQEGVQNLRITCATLMQNLRRTCATLTQNLRDLDAEPAQNLRDFDAEPAQDLHDFDAEPAQELRSKYKYKYKNQEKEEEKESSLSSFPETEIEPYKNTIHIRNQKGVRLDNDNAPRRGGVSV